MRNLDGLAARASVAPSEWFAGLRHWERPRMRPPTARRAAAPLSDAKLLHSSVRTTMSTNCGLAGGVPVVTFSVTKLEICDLFGELMIRFGATRVLDRRARPAANQPRFRQRP